MKFHGSFTIAMWRGFHESEYEMAACVMRNPEFKDFVGLYCAGGEL